MVQGRRRTAGSPPVNREMSTTSQKALQPSDPSRPPRPGDEDRLGQHQEQHQLLAEADRLEHGDLGGPLAHRHRHRIARDAEQREDDRQADPVDHAFEVAEHLREHLAERFLGLGPGRGVAVAVQVVDLLAQGGHDVGVLALDEDHARVARARAGGQRPPDASSS